MARSSARAAAASIFCVIALAVSFAIPGAAVSVEHGTKDVNIDLRFKKQSDTVEYPARYYYPDVESPVEHEGIIYSFTVILDISDLLPGTHSFTQKDFMVTVGARLPNGDRWLEFDMNAVHWRLVPERFTLTITKNMTKVIPVTIPNQTIVYGDPLTISMSSIKVGDLTGRDLKSVVLGGTLVDGRDYLGGLIEAGVHHYTCLFGSDLYSVFRVTNGWLTVLPQTRYSYAGAVPSAAPAPPGPGSASYSTLNAFPQMEAPEGYEFSGWSSPDAKTEPGGFTVAEGCPSVVRFTGSWKTLESSVDAPVVETPVEASPLDHSLTFLLEGKRVGSFILRAGDSVSAAADAAARRLDPPARGFEFSGWENLPESMPDRDLTVEGSYRRTGYVASFVVDGREVGWSLLSPGDEVVPVGLEAVAAGLKEGQYLKWEDFPSLMPERDITVSGVVVTPYTSRLPGSLEKSLCVLNILFALACAGGFLLSASDILGSGQKSKPLAFMLSAVPACASGFLLAVTLDFSRKPVSGDPMTPVFAMLALFQIFFSVTLRGIADANPRPARAGGDAEAAPAPEIDSPRTAGAGGGDSR